MDKLENLIKLMNKKENTYENTARIMMSFLTSLSNNTEAFLFLYDNLKKDEKPDWKSNSYFREVYVKVITSLNDDEFNHRFFVGLEDILNIELVRNLSLEKPLNQRLKEFVQEKDKPTKINDIMKLLSDCYDKDNEKFEQYLITYHEQLKKMNAIKAEKSYALTTLMNLLEYEYKKNGFNSMLVLSQKLSFNLIEKLKKGEMPDKIKLFNTRYNPQNMHEVIDTLNKEPIELRYSILKNLTYIDNPINLLKLFHDKKEHVETIFSWINAYLIDLSQRVIYQLYTKRKPPSDNSSDILNNIIENKDLMATLEWHNLPFPELNEIQRNETIVSYWNVLNLEAQLPNNNTKTNKPKI